MFGLAFWCKMTKKTLRLSLIPWALPFPPFCLSTTKKTQKNGGDDHHHHRSAATTTVLHSFSSPVVSPILLSSCLSRSPLLSEIEVKAGKGPEAVAGGGPKAVAGGVYLRGTSVICISRSQKESPKVTICYFFKITFSSFSKSRFKKYFCFWQTSLLCGTSSVNA